MIRVPPVVAAAAPVLLAGVAAAQPVSTTILGRSGTSAPGLPGLTFADFADARLNAAGTTLLWGRLGGAGVAPENDGSLWLLPPGAHEPTLVVRERQAAPGTTLVLGGPATGLLDDASRVAVITGAGPATPALALTNTALYAPDFTAAGVPLALEVQSVAPDPGAFVGLTLAAMAGSGALAFASDNGAVIWTDRADPALPPGLHALARRGDAAPGLDGRVLLYLDRPGINAGARVAFRASLGDAATPPADLNTHALYTDLGGTLTPVAVVGGPTPIPGVAFDRLSQVPSVDSSGVTFWARLAGEGVDAATRESIWRWTPAGGLALLARAGDTAPGADTGAGPVRFRAFTTFIPTTSTGEGAVLATLDTADTAANTGLWALGPTGIGRLITREGAPLPGAGADGPVLTSFANPAISESGRVTFLARLSSAAAAPADNHALLSAPPVGPLTLLARTGSAVEVAPGDTRTVRHLLFDGAPGTPAPGGNGPVAALPASRERVLYRVVFTDFSTALLSATIACRADFDGSGQHETVDVFAFLSAWFASALSADVDANGAVDMADFFAFLSAWFTGC